MAVTRFHSQLTSMRPIEEWNNSSEITLPPATLDLKVFGTDDPSEAVKKVYNLAHLGMSNRLIAGSFGINHETLARHFSKTIAKAKADKAEVLYRIIEDRANFTDYKAESGPDMDCVKYILKRVDPEPKETPDVVINQTFGDKGPVQSLTSINAELLE